MNSENSQNGFKMTEIGLLPEEWEVVNLGRVTNLIMGQSPPGNTYNSSGEGMPFLQGKAEFTDLFPRHIKYTTKPLKIAPMNSILMSVRAPVGDVNIADIDYCIGRGLASISFRDGSNEFLFYLLKFYKKSLENEGYGSTFKAINRTKIEDFKIPLPPLPEQKKIAAVLSAVQEAREKTEAVIAAAKELKKSLMKYLFTYGPVPVAEADQVRLKETEIGVMPEEWEKSIVEDVAEITSGGTPNRNIKEFWGGTIPWVKTGEIKYNEIIDTEEKITIEGMENSSAKIIPKGTLLMAMYGQGVTRGKVAILGIDAAINQACAAIITNDKINTKFLYHYFEFKYEDIRKLGHGANQRNLNANMIKKINVILPDLITQHRINEFLSILDQKISSEQSKKQALDQLFKSLLNNLMTGKIRVNHLEL